MSDIEVTLRRQRMVEEKVVTIVSASSPEDAIAACKHLADGQVVDWKYARTVEVSQAQVEVKEVKSKKGG